MAKLVVVHCADTPNDKEFNANDIHQWHTEQGWAGIGYHWVIDRKGQPEPGRPEYWTGAHVKGHNTGSIGICLIGRDQFTWKQFKTLFDELIPQLEAKYGEIELRGHFELDSSKTCPNFNPKDLRTIWQRKLGMPKEALWTEPT